MTKSHPILLPLTLVVVFQINSAMTILVCPQGNERIAPEQYCDNQVDCSIGLDDVNTDFFLNGGHCLSVFENTEFGAVEIVLFYCFSEINDAVGINSLCDGRIDCHNAADETFYLCEGLGDGIHCYNGGTAITGNVCHCAYGWSGQYCETPKCHIPCQNGGTCVAPNICDCPSHYKGKFCEQLNCTLPCENGGVCVAHHHEFKCACIHNFFGDLCQMSSCSPPCQNGGVCTPDGCQCQEGFTGSDCGTNEMQMGMGGDPHFMVLLQDLHSLCYSVQGMAGFPFNLVSSRDFVMNAVFINAQHHIADYATYLGEIGILFNSGDKTPIKLHFKSLPKTMTISGFGMLNAARVRKVVIKGKEMEVQRQVLSGNWNSEVLIDISEVGISFKIYYQHDHLDLVWSQTSYFNQLQKEQSHGLIGQFFNKGVSIDVKRHELVMPSGRSVRVELKEYWPEVHQKKGNCWRAMNPGYQGDELIEGHYLDYVVDHVFATEFEYSRAFKNLS